MAGTCNGYGRQALLRLTWIVSTSSDRRGRNLLNLENRHPFLGGRKESSKTLLSSEHRDPFESGITHEDLVKLRAQALLRMVHERDYSLKDTSHLEDIHEAGDTSLVSGRRSTTLPARAWSRLPPAETWTA